MAVLALLACVGISVQGTSETPPATLSVSADLLEAGESQPLRAPWRYLGADLDPAVDIDDSGWELVDPSLAGRQTPRDFSGRAVFRLRLEISGRLSGRPLALAIRQTGASEVYIDGRRIVSYGRLDGSAAFSPLVSAVLALDAGTHILAVRYSCPDFRRFHNAGQAAGLRASIGLAGKILPQEVARVASRSAATWLFTGVFLAFALLHGSLFLFHRGMRENLWFSLLCAANASLAFFLFGRDTQTDPRFLLFSEPAMNASGLAFAASAVLFVRETFGPTPGPRLFVGLGTAALLLTPWVILRPGASITVVFLVMLAACAEALRGVLVAVVKRRPGAALVGTGAACLALGFAIGLLAYLGVLPANITTRAFVPFTSMAAMLFFSSLHLSNHFAKMNRELQRRLVDVERLSAEKLDGERRLAKEELSRQLLSAEYERKTQELEDARRLQTSMLPKNAPDLPNLAIAARMATATEVGGDYYDFDVSETGVVTVAIGDATGHGMRAGTLVTATKGLFGALAREPELISALTRSSAALRRMNLRTLAMALTLVRIAKGSMRVAAAGMPPVLIHRQAADVVEPLVLSGTPLGALRAFPYTERTVDLGIGDTVVLMSDGLPERLNAEDGMLGYERVEELVHNHANASPSEIADRLLAEGDVWAAGRPPEDDVTIVVLRRLA